MRSMTFFCLPFSNEKGGAESKLDWIRNSNTNIINPFKFQYCSAHNMWKFWLTKRFLSSLCLSNCTDKNLLKFL